MSKIDMNRVATCIAIYDWKQDVPVCAQGALIQDVLCSYGLSPNCFFAARGEEQRKLSLDGFEKITSYIDNSVTSVAMYRLLGKPMNLIDGWSSYGGTTSGVGRAKSAHLALEVSNADWRMIAAEILERMASVFAGGYGIGLQIPFAEGPSYFLNDIQYHGSPRGIEPDKRREMELWYQERLDLIAQGKKAPFRHLTGSLRDVFPVNLLNSKQVNARFGNFTLASRLQDDVDLGKFRELSGGSGLWIADDEEICRARGILTSQGLLIGRPEI